MTSIYRGNVSQQYPWEQRDGYWYPLSEPYPVVSLAHAGPDFDRTGMPVLVVADPDQSDHTDLLADLDYYGDDRHVATVDEWHALLRAAAVALRATLAQRDEAHTRVAELEAAGERLMSTTAKSTLTWRSDRVAANDARRAWRALVSPPTASDPTFRDTRPAAKAHRATTGHQMAIVSAAASSCAECDWPAPDPTENPDA